MAQMVDALHHRRAITGSSPPAFAMRGNSAGRVGGHPGSLVSRNMGASVRRLSDALTELIRDVRERKHIQFAEGV